MHVLLRSLALLTLLGLLGSPVDAQRHTASADTQVDGPLLLNTAAASGSTSAGIRPALRPGEIHDPLTGAPATPAEAARHLRANRASLRAAALAETPRGERRTRPAAATPPESGGGLVVDNGYDDPDVNPGDGFCSTSFFDCTLRAAIEEANATSGSGTVVVGFDISFGPTGSEIAPGVWRIRPGFGGFGALPTVTRSNVVLDASTQSGAACGALTTGTAHTIRVVLDGALMVGSEAGLVASASASGFVARGFAVSNFPGRGVIFGENVANLFSNSLVECNYIGSDYTGMADEGNDGGGIHVSGGSPFFLFGVTVQNNLVSGNGNQGIYVTRQQVTIRDNIVGLAADGLSRLTGAPGVSNALGGIRIVSADVTVDGNVVTGNGNAGPGIGLGSLTGPFAPVATRVAVTDNLVGLNRNGFDVGVGSGGNGDFGIWIHEGAFDNDIGLGTPGTGNRVADSGGGARNGIVVSGTGTNDNRVRNNLVGFDAVGIALPNANGIYVGDVFSDGAPSGTLVGAPGAPNVVAGNDFRGILLLDDIGTVVEDNVVGLGTAGFALPNGDAGITLDGSTDPIVRDNTVGGNGGSGITLQDLFGSSAPTTGALIEANRVGTDASGTAARPNALSGIAVLAAVGTTVRDNVIAANTDTGLYLDGTSEVLVDGNSIGTDAGASLDLGNGLSGIHCQSATDVRVGSPTGVPFNTIAFNGGDGIFLRDGCQDVAILTNRIHDNDGLGIDLFPGGVTPNDPGDGDAGANALTNFPVVTSATNDGSGSTVSYTLDALPNQTYRVQLYRSAAPDPSGNGEGAAAVFAPTITTDASGQASQTLNLGSSQFPVGVWVAGIATPVDGGTFTGFRGTSEFGPAMQVQAAGGPPLALTLTPTNPTPPVTIARGARLFYDATFAIGASGPSQFEYWAEAVLPNGSTRSLFGPVTVSTTPGTTVTLSLSQRVPNGAPLGNYTFRMLAGTFPGTVLTQDSFPVTVTASEAVAGGEGDDDWTAYDERGSVLEAGAVQDLRTDGIAAAAQASSVARPEAFTLHAAAPNPFRGSTTLRFDVPETSDVNIAVYDALGRRVAALHDGPAEVGTHALRFDASGLPSGVYVVRLLIGGNVGTFPTQQRVTLVR